MNVSNNLYFVKQILKLIWEFIGDVVPDAVGALIGVMGALYLFKLQLKGEKEQEQVKASKEEIELLRFSGIIVESIISTFEKEIVELQKYHKRYDDEPYLQIDQPYGLATNDIQRLLKIMEGKEYLNSYLKQIGGSTKDLMNYNKIAKSIDYLSIVRDQIQNFVNLAIDRDLERRNLYNSNVIKNLNALKDYCYSNILTHREFLQLIMPVQIVYGNDDSFNLDQHARRLIHPVIGLIQHNYHSDINLKSIEFELHQALGIANHVIYNNGKFADDIGQMVDDIKLTINVLKDNSSKLRKYTQDNNGYDDRFAIASSIT